MAFQKACLIHIQALSMNWPEEACQNSPRPTETRTSRAKLTTGIEKIANLLLFGAEKGRRYSGQSGDVPGKWEECRKCSSSKWTGSACWNSELSDTRPSSIQACPLSTKTHSESFACRSFPLSKARLVLPSPCAVVPVVPPAENVAYGNLGAID